MVFGQELTKEQQQVVFDFIDCIKYQNKEKLMGKVSLPFERAYPIPQIKSRQEFLNRYNEVFDDEIIKRIVQSKPSKDWSAVGYRGIMLSNGEVWLDYDGRLMTVNYQSKVDEKWKEELIRLEKNNLHESINDFKQPVHVLETAKYRIRIDDMGEHNYRYTSWHLNSKMSVKPDIVIENGEYKPDGSGGNHSFRFRNGTYIYECAIILMGEEDAPPASVTIYKGDIKILSQRAAIVIK